MLGRKKGQQSTFLKVIVGRSHEGILKGGRTPFDKHYKKKKKKLLNLVTSKKILAFHQSLKGRWPNSNYCKISVTRERLQRGVSSSLEKINGAKPRCNLVKQGVPKGREKKVGGREGQKKPTG